MHSLHWVKQEIRSLYKTWRDDIFSQEFSVGSNYIPLEKDHSGWRPQATAADPVSNFPDPTPKIRIRQLNNSSQSMGLKISVKWKQNKTKIRLCVLSGWIRIQFLLRVGFHIRFFSWGLFLRSIFSRGVALININRLGSQTDATTLFYGYLKPAAGWHRLMNGILPSRWARQRSLYVKY